MNSIWLMWCSNEQSAYVRQSLQTGYRAKRFVRLASTDDISQVLEAFEDQTLSVAIAIDGDLVSHHQAEAMCSLLEKSDRVTNIVVFTQAPDAGIAARCFSAGATEVIAAGNAEVSSCLEHEVCAKRESAPGEDYSLEECVLPASDDILKTTTKTSFGCVQDDPEQTGLLELTDESFESNSFSQTGQQQSESKEESASRAPMVSVISGRGGSGKTTLTAAMAAYAARIGLRTAVIDLDLMFGNLSSCFGAEHIKGIEELRAHIKGDVIADCDVEQTAMRVGTGLTLWGPCATPEYAEMCSQPVEQLIEKLRGAADVIFVDTSCYWSDAVAMAVSASERCLVVGSCQEAGASAKRAVELAARLGVPRARMTSVFNRMSTRGDNEEQAITYELEVALRSKARILDGDRDVADLLFCGHTQDLIAGSNPFAVSVRSFTGSLLQELGCPVSSWVLEEERQRASHMNTARFRLLWKHKAGDAL